MVSLETWNILSSDTCTAKTPVLFMYILINLKFEADVWLWENTNFINLTQNSIDADSMIYQWQFIDTISGILDTITNTDYEPSYEFQSSSGGWFYVNLTMIDVNQCKNTYSDSVLVAKLPTIVYDTSICNTATICFGE